MPQTSSAVGSSGDVAVDGAGLQSVEKVCKVGVGLLFDAFNLIDGVQVERACLSGNGRALEIGNGLCTRQIGLLPRAAGGKRQTEQGCC